MTDFPAFGKMTDQHWTQAHRMAPPECDDLLKCIEKVCLEQGSAYNQQLEPDMFSTLKGGILDIYRSFWTHTSPLNFSVRAMNYITAKNLSGDLCKGRQRNVMVLDLPREPVASTTAKPGLQLPGQAASVMFGEGGWRWVGNTAGNTLVLGGIIVALAWVIANDLHPAGAGDDAQIPILWSRLVETVQSF